MKKRIVIGATVLALVGVLLGACGVPQEDLDAAEVATAAAQAQVTSLQADLDDAESDLAKAQGDTADAEARLATAETDLAAAEAATATLETAVTEAEAATVAAEEATVAAEAATVAAEAAAAAAVAAAEAAAAEAAAEEPAAEEPAAEEAAASYGYVHPAELSFAGSAAEEVSEDWSASFQHPDDFSGDFSGIAYTPSFGFGLTFTVYPAADYDTFEAALLGDGLLSGIEIANLYETALADGTPASLAEFTANTDTYDFNVFSIGVVHGDNWVVIHVRGWGEYDEPYMAEIVHTLTLTGGAAAADDSAADEAPVVDPNAVQGSLEPTTFDYLTYEDATYGFTIAYDAGWTSGEKYYAYERLGNAAQYAVPALSMYPDDYEAVDNPEYDPDELKVSDYDGDYGAYILVEQDGFTEILSETPGVLVNGTPVTIHQFTFGGTFPGWTIGMYVEVNGIGIMFTIGGDANLLWGVEDNLTSALELLLSLDF